MVELDFDVVIIGSGAGGGAVASELAELARQGAKIAVLEWGPKFVEEAFTGQEFEMAERLYFDGGAFMTRDRSMSLAFAKAYGGSTVVYTGTSLTISEEDFSRWGLPDVSWPDLMRRSAKFLEQNSVHLLPPEDLNDNNQLFAKGCKALGYEAKQFPVNLKGCQGAGLCNLGCPHGAKQGTHRVQLPQAERAGVTVVTSCKALRLEGGCVEAQVLESGSAWKPGRYRLRAKAVVVAAGAVNSPALLLRSRLPVPLPALGRYFTVHPALILSGQHERPIKNQWGHPKSFFCDRFAEKRRFLLETCMYFPFVTAKNLGGFGPGHEAMMSGMDRLQMILALALDEALPGNRVTIDGRGEPVVDYTLTPAVLESLLWAQRESARILFAAGARRVHAPAGRDYLLEADQADRLDELIESSRMLPGSLPVTAAHLMGGCRMGSGPEDSVTDSWGQVHGLPWLFVADASLFPRCAGINPYITIMALADRVAERVRGRLAGLPAAGGRP